MAYVAKHYVPIGRKMYTPGEVIEEKMDKKTLDRLIKLKAVEKLGKAEPEEEETAEETQEGKTSAQDSDLEEGAEEEEPDEEEAEEEAEEEEPAPEIDVMAAVVSEPEPEEAPKPKNTRKTGTGRK